MRTSDPARRLASGLAVLLVIGCSLSSPRHTLAQLVAIGGEFAVSTDTAAPAAAPKVAIRDDGAFVVVWHDSQARALFGQRFDGAGLRRGAAFRINEASFYGGFSSLGMSRDGDFVVAWYELGGANARRFTSAGRPLGDEFQVTEDAYYGLDLARGAGGNFVVAWENDEVGSSGASTTATVSSFATISRSPAE
jgi:hypothetical protein